MKLVLLSLAVGCAVVLQLVIAKSSTTCSCGWINKGRIVGGNVTTKHKYPLVAALIDTTIGEQVCGGSIITPWHILTAAHCCTSSPEEMKIRVGVTNWRKDYGRDYAVEKIIIHEDYDTFYTVNDIAILVTKTEIQFNQNIGPVCMPNKRLDLAGERVTVMGWGYLQTGGPGSDDLREVELGVISKSDCEIKWKHPKPQLYEKTICTYEKGKDSCQEDSGGPVVWRDPEINRLVLAGVVSFGDRCAGPYPGFNSDPSAYLDWITSKIDETKPGVKICTKA